MTDEVAYDPTHPPTTSASQENLFPSVVGGFFALVFIVIVYHCYLRRQQRRTPYNDELSNCAPIAEIKNKDVVVEIKDMNTPKE